MNESLLSQLIEKMRQEYLDLSKEAQAEQLASVTGSRLSPAGKAIILFAMTEEVSYLEEAVKERA